ncbi:MAG: hypothetical protein Q4Q62_03615 [Thermoplasmata archaeon]|nr:hypothetical protein [Thermoplasmata archaeon]
MSYHRYIVAGFAAFLIALTAVMFSDTSRTDPDYTGVVTDISETTSGGYTFYLTTHDGSFKCYWTSRPVEYGYYGVCGSFSSDGSILFVSSMSILLS